MSDSPSRGKKLFVCTRPFQYLVARLMKEGSGYLDCDLMVLNHFHGSKDFCERVEQLGVWKRVFYYDDSVLNDYKLKLNPVEKYFFYRTWPKFIPAPLPDVSEYTEVFLAHDGVAAEYAIMRQFRNADKPTNVYEEGFGSYIDNSTHLTLSKRLMKNISPIFGLPGGYIGGLKWIQSIWLQHPELVTVDGRNPLRRKAKQLPMRFTEFMQLPGIIEEMFNVFPELRIIDDILKEEKRVSLVLTDLWLDELGDREACTDTITAKVRETVGSGDPILIKQHPGERLVLKERPGWRRLPQSLPIELLYLVMLRNRMEKVSLFSFGSTAVLNLYELCREDGNLDIYLIGSMSLAEEYRIIATRFRDLAGRCHVQYRSV